MGYGMALPLFGFDETEVDARHFRRGASAIEAAGFDSLWVFDAVGRGFAMPDPLMALAVAATVTERLTLGTGVLQLPIRNTVEVAHRILTLHLLCGDRLWLGVGPGSTADDFHAFGADYGERGQRFETQLAELLPLLRTGRLADVDLTPWPVAVGGPSILVGAWRGKWVERSAQDFDGWIASGMHSDDEALATALARYRDAGGGRAVVTNVQLGHELERGLERMERLHALGFDEVVALDRSPSEDRIAAAAEHLGLQP